jgi:phosphatidate cytidylyltransferase
MFGHVLIVVAVFYTAGGLLVAAQRWGRAAGSCTGWGKYATYGFFLAAVLTVAHLGELVYTAAVLILLVLSLLEYGRAVGLSVVSRIGLVAFGLTLAAGAVWGGATALYPLAVALALATLAAGALASEPRPGLSHGIWAATGIVAVATPAVHLLFIAQDANRFALFAFLFLVVSSSDAFAEMVGKRWGIGRGFLRASPEKSISGLLAGLVAALTLAAVLHAAIAVWTAPRAVAVGLAVWVAATLGDLIASSLKRTLGIKDFGNALPGHGGILDRFDSLILAALPYYWVMGG